MRRGLGIAIVLLPMICWGQPDTLWTRLYDDSDFDFAYAVQQTPDGGFVIAGQRGPDYHFLLVKTDSLGNPEWMRTSGPNGSYAYDVQLTEDGGYIMAGYFYGAREGQLVKANSLGWPQWSLSVGGYFWVCFNSVVECPDGDFLAAGYAGPNGNTNACLVRTTRKGT
jgi:hypothetical protein